MKYALLYGSYREGRQGIKVVKFIKNLIEKAGDEAFVLDAKEKNFPILNKMYKEYDEGTAPKFMSDVHDVLTKVDGFILVTGEYNHSVQAGLKNMVDHFMPEYFWKPTGIVSYSAGGFGGVRCAIQWRIIMGELGSVTIPSIFSVSDVYNSINENGVASDDALISKTKKFFDELEWYAKTLRRGREKGAPY